MLDLGKIARAAAVAVPLAASLLFAPAAWAAEAHVVETPGGDNLAELVFTASPGEGNHLTLTFPRTGNGLLQIHLVDTGAEIAAGGGCSGGGEPGVVDCLMHPPKFWDEEYCGKLCFRPIPGTSWFDSFAISLGDGNNVFDASALPELGGPPIAMNVTSGAGDDKITTAYGEDRIDPGAGSDEVRSGDGFDRIKATPSPDGPDLYESGPSVDKLSYELRSDPIILSGTTAGAVGEGDTLRGDYYLVGGSGDDLLSGGPTDFALDGGPGNDVISGEAEGNNLYGGPGDDRLSTENAPAGSLNHLVGEEGNDTFYGGEGSDIMRESEAHSDWGAKPENGPNPDPSGGNDVAYGGGGRDIIELRGGNDRGYGGSGNDLIHGGAGADLLSGGDGADVVIGGSGFDWLYGGIGSDRLFSGHWVWHVSNFSFPFPPTGDDGPDRVGCGAGEDFASSTSRDRLHSCEHVRLRR